MSKKAVVACCKINDILHSVETLETPVFAHPFRELADIMKGQYSIEHYKNAPLVPITDQKLSPYPYSLRSTLILSSYLFSASYFFLYFLQVFHLKFYKHFSSYYFLLSKNSQGSVRKMKRCVQYRTFLHWILIKTRIILSPHRESAVLSKKKEVGKNIHFCKYFEQKMLYSGKAHRNLRVFQCQIRY